MRPHGYTAMSLLLLLLLLRMASCLQRDKRPTAARARVCVCTRSTYPPNETGLNVAAGFLRIFSNDFNVSGRFRFCTKYSRYSNSAAA